MRIRTERRVVVFGMLLALLGVFFFWISCGRNSWNWHRARNWQPAAATVLWSSSRDANDPPGLFILLRYSFEADGEPREGDTYSFSNFAMEDSRVHALLQGPLAPGRPIGIFYNPENPSESVVNRSFDRRWLLGLMGLLGSLIGVAWMIQNHRDVIELERPGPTHPHKKSRNERLESPGGDR
jgi:hypothetical protein